MEDGELLSNELQYLPEDKHSKDLSVHNLDLDSLVRLPSANITKDLKAFFSSIKDIQIILVVYNC